MNLECFCNFSFQNPQIYPVFQAPIGVVQTKEAEEVPKCHLHKKVKPGCRMCDNYVQKVNKKPVYISITKLELKV